MATGNNDNNVDDGKQDRSQPLHDYHLSNIWNHGRLDMNYVEGMQNGDSIIEFSRVTSNATFLGARSNDKTCVRVIWQKKDELQTIKSKVLTEICFQDSKLALDEIYIFRNSCDDINKGFDEQHQDYVFAQTVIASNHSTNTSLFVFISWMGDGEDIKVTIEEYDKNSVFGSAITPGTGIIANEFGEFLMVGGANGDEALKSEISRADKKYVWQVLKRGKEGWQVVQQDFLPDAWGANTAQLCYNGNAYNAVCACSDDGWGVMVGFK